MCELSGWPLLPLKPLKFLEPLKLTFTGIFNCPNQENLAGARFSYKNIYWVRIASYALLYYLYDDKFPFQIYIWQVLNDFGALKNSKSKKTLLLRDFTIKINIY